ISYTMRVQHHQMFAFGMVLVGPDGTAIKSEFYVHGEDAMECFVKTLFDWEKEILQAKNEANVGMPPDWTAPSSITDCFICRKPLDIKPSDPVVRDHDHYTGMVRIIIQFIFFSFQKNT